MMDEELLPCPFCGGKAKLRGGKARFYDTPFWWWIECTQCVASTRGDGDVDVVLQLWNSRFQETCKWEVVIRHRPNNESEE